MLNLFRRALWPDLTLGRRVVLIRSWLTVALLIFMAACGGGGGGGGSTPNRIQAVLLNSVVVPGGSEAANYSVVSDSQLTYSGTTPPSVGTVLILSGSAYKVASVSTVDGKFMLGTSPPEIEDVFETFIISEDIALSTGAAVSRLPSGIELAIPDVKIDTATSFPDFPLAGTGTLKQGILHAELNYQLSKGGWQPGSELSIRGELDFNLVARAKVGTFKTSFTIPDLNVPLAFALGTVSVKASTRFEFKIESLITANAGALTYKRTIDSGMRRSASEWEFFDRGATVAASAQNSDETLLAQALALLSPSAKAAMTFSVSPILVPRLSAFNDTLGILGMALKPAAKGKLELSELEQPPCAKFSSSLDFTAHALIRGPSIKIPFFGGAFEEDDEVEIDGVALPVSASIPLTGPTPVGFCSYTLAVTPPNTVLALNGSQQLTGIVSASGLTLSPLVLVPQPSLTWTSDSPSVTVDATGLVRAVAPGTATITVSDTKHNTSTRVVVNVNAAAGAGTGIAQEVVKSCASYDYPGFVMNTCSYTIVFTLTCPGGCSSATTLFEIDRFAGQVYQQNTGRSTVGGWYFDPARMPALTPDGSGQIVVRFPAYEPTFRLYRYNPSPEPLSYDQWYDGELRIRLTDKQTGALSIVSSSFVADISPADSR